MKTAKRLASILLTLCMLIGLPVAVQAVGGTTTTPKSLELLNVFELPDDMCMNEADKGKYAILQFNTPLNASSLVEGAEANKMRKLNTTNMVIKIEALDSNGNRLEGGYCTGYAGSCYFNNSSTLNFYSIYFAGSNSFAVWRDKGATQFKVYIYELSTATSPQNGSIDNWKSNWITGNPPLKATTTEAGCDAIVLNVVGKDDVLRFEQANMVSDTEIMAKFSEAVEVARYKTSFDMNLCVVGADGTVIWEQATQEAGSLEKVGADGWVRVPVDSSVMTAAQAKLDENEGATLKLKIYEVWVAEATFAGETTENYMIDALYTTTNKALCVSDNTGAVAKVMVDVVDLRGKEAIVGGTAYESVAAAVEAAKAGETVSLLKDAVNAGPVFVLNANVNLDLNGYTLTAENFMAFGHVTDSTDGEGKLIIGKDKYTDLLADNAAMPLYDGNGYRFFDYEFLYRQNVSPVAGANQYAVRLAFNKAKAYELLAANDDLKIGVNMTVTKDEGKVQHVNYVFSDNAMNEYAAQSAADMARSKAITLTVHGVDGLNLTAQSSLTSPTRIALGGDLVMAQ